jgi:hypothetical protein
VWIPSRVVIVGLLVATVLICLGEASGQVEPIASCEPGGSAKPIGGTVKLTKRGHDEPGMTQLPASCNRNASPVTDPERPRSEQPVVNSVEQVTADPEEILNDAVHRCEALQLGGRLEPAHLALALPPQNRNSRLILTMNARFSSWGNARGASVSRCSL